MTHLCLGGGSIRGICILGALHYLYITNKITKINKLHACSVGSMIGVLLILGQTPKEIFDYLSNTDFRKYWDFDISRINSQFSLLGQSIFDFFREYLSSLTDINITFEDFSNKYDVDINIITTCINTKKSVIMNKQSFPNAKVIDAVIASSSIPFLFPPVKIHDLYYVDGSVRVFSGCLNETIDSNTVVIKIEDTLCKSEDIKFDNFKEYALLILKSMISHELTATSDYTLTINVPTKFCGKYNFNDLTLSDKIDMFLVGLKQSEHFFNELTLPDELDKNENNIDSNETNNN